MQSNFLTLNCHSLCQKYYIINICEKSVVSETSTIYIQGSLWNRKHVTYKFSQVWNRNCGKPGSNLIKYFYHCLTVSLISSYIFKSICWHQGSLKRLYHWLRARSPHVCNRNLCAGLCHLVAIRGYFTPLDGHLWAIWRSLYKEWNVLVQALHFSAMCNSATNLKYVFWILLALFADFRQEYVFWFCILSYALFSNNLPFFLWIISSGWWKT